jgi:hypothetical protein
MDTLARESTVKKVGLGAVQGGAPIYVLWSDADTQEHGKKGHPYPCGVRVACVQHDIGMPNETFILYKCGLLQSVSQEQLEKLVKKSNEILASKIVTKMQQKLRVDMEPWYLESDGDEHGYDERDNERNRVIVPETQDPFSTTTKQASSDSHEEQGQEDEQHQEQQQLQAPGSHQEQLEVHDQRETIPPRIYTGLSNDPLPFVPTQSFVMSVKELREAEAKLKAAKHQMLLVKQGLVETSVSREKKNTS